VKLAERLIELIPTADWAFFWQKRRRYDHLCHPGSAAYTNRKKIIMVRGHYHGVAPWCTGLGFGGITPEDHIHILQVNWNDLDGFEKLVRQYRGEIAGFIAQPYHHINFGDQVMPAPGYWEGIERICRERRHCPHSRRCPCRFSPQHEGIRRLLRLQARPELLLQSDSQRLPDLSLRRTQGADECRFEGLLYRLLLDRPGGNGRLSGHLAKSWKKPTLLRK